MSYILDALRKADAQRAGNPARGIHAQPAALPTVRLRRPMKLWISIGAAMLVLAAGVGAWWLGDDAGVAPSASRSTPAFVLGTPAAAPPLTPATTVVVLAPAVPAPVPAPAVLPPAAPAATQPPAAVATAQRVARLPNAAASVPVATSSVTAPATTVATVAAPDATTASSRIYTMTDLPADAQQAFPKLSISGGVYSDNVAQRMLVVNGQVYNEGSEIAPGVVLEQVRARTAVLKFRGLRLSHPY